MYCPHEHLEDVEDSIILWKYMNFSKFVALLVAEGLWFSRLDRFEDVFEGRYPAANKKLRPDVYGDVLIPQEIYDATEKMRYLLFVSCFHVNNYESSAMWSLYSKDEGIAIQTTAKLLKESFLHETRNIYLTKVNYIDYENEFMPEGNIMYLATHKRKSFEHEKEVRCIYNNPLTNPTEKGGFGFSAKMDLNKLIQKVYISPFAQSFIEQIITNLLHKFNLSANVISSKLYTLTK